MQIVLVTGGNQGLGLETAKALAVAGAHVIIGSRTQIKAEQCVWHDRVPYKRSPQLRRGI